MYPVHPFTFPSTKAGDERLLAFMVRGRFYPAIIRRISASNYHWQPLHFLKSRCWSLPFLSSGRCLSRTRNLRKVLSTGIQSTSTAFSLKPSISCGKRGDAKVNPSQVKLCNLLYLLTMYQPSNSGLVIEMTQEDIADILGMSRVQITRELTDLRSRGILSTTRGRLTVTDLPALASLCTDETM